MSRLSSRSASARRCGWLLLACVILPAALPARAQPASERPGALVRRDAGRVPPVDGWSARLGAGVAVGPAYPGSESIMPAPLPIIDLAYRPGLVGLDTIFLSAREGLGVIPLRFGPIAVGASVSFLPGRDQDVAARLAGLGDIDPAATGNLFVRGEFGPFGLSARLERGLGGQEGTTVTLGAAWRMPLAPRLLVMAQAGVTWADGEHIQQWFGVDATQAARSRFGRYDAGAGFRNVSAGINAIYLLGERWELSAGVGVSQLLGDAADSPITQQATQPFGVLGVGYRF
jgi:outer membrane protein